jgi:hypothetical protein
MRGDRSDLESVDCAALHIFLEFVVFFLALCGVDTLKLDDLNSDAAANSEAI